MTRSLPLMALLAGLGHAQEAAPQPDLAAGEEAKRAITMQMELMKEAGKLSAEQADDLCEIVFPEDDWDARCESYLQVNPGLAKAVESGTITPEQVLAGMKARAREQPSKEEQLEALYQEMLEGDPTLGRTPKEALMPGLEARLARGEGRNLRPRVDLRTRLHTFGR